MKVKPEFMSSPRFAYVQIILTRESTKRTWGSFPGPSPFENNSPPHSSPPFLFLLPITTPQYPDTFLLRRRETPRSLLPHPPLPFSFLLHLSVPISTVSAKHAMPNLTRPAAAPTQSAKTRPISLSIPPTLSPFHVSTPLPSFLPSYLFSFLRLIAPDNNNMMNNIKPAISATCRRRRCSPNPAGSYSTASC